MTVSPLLLGELNELCRGRQRVEQGPAAAASEVVLGLNDQGGQVICGACWNMVNRRSSVKYFPVVSRPWAAMRARKNSARSALLLVYPDRARSGGREPFGCAPGQERITQLARSCENSLTV
jgi:hypothetical protein